MPAQRNINNNNKVRLTLLDNVNVCLESFGDHVMHLVFGCDTRVDVARMGRAIRLSLDLDPILGCRLVEQGWRPYWSRWPEAELDRFQYCDLVVAADTDRQIEMFLLQPMNCRTEPMVQARVIRADRDVVVLNVSCVPIDGRGLLIYLERLLVIYNRLQSEPDFRPEIGTYSQRSTADLVKRFRWHDVFKLLYYGLANQWIDHGTAGNWRFPVRTTTTRLDKTFTAYQFKNHTLARIKSYRRQTGCTFNDILLAAFYDSLQKIIAPKSGTTCCVLNTYDLRRYEYGTGPERVANYSSFVNSNVKLERNLPFSALVGRVQSAMAARKRHLPGITEGPFIWPVFKLLPFSWARTLVSSLMQRRGEHIPVLTNVGIINMENLRLDGHRIPWLLPYAPLEYPPKLTVTLATVGDVVTLTLGYSRNHFDPADIEALFRGMEAVILENCQLVPANTAATDSADTQNLANV